MSSEKIIRNPLKVPDKVVGGMSSVFESVDEAFPFLTSRFVFFDMSIGFSFYSSKFKFAVVTGLTLCFWHDVVTHSLSWFTVEFHRIRE